MKTTSTFFDLEHAPIGVALRIQSLTAEASLRQHFIDLGLIPGAQVTVLARDVGTLVLIGAARYALGAKIASQIEVARTTH